MKSFTLRVPTLIACLGVLAAICASRGDARVCMQREREEPAKPDSSSISLIAQRWNWPAALPESQATGGRVVRP